MLQGENILPGCPRDGDAGKLALFPMLMPNEATSPRTVGVSSAAVMKTCCNWYLFVPVEIKSLHRYPPAPMRQRGSLRVYLLTHTSFIEPSGMRCQFRKPIGASITTAFLPPTFVGLFRSELLEVYRATHSRIYFGEIDVATYGELRGF